MSADFYAKLVPLTSFAAITNPANFVALPDDWRIVLTDVRGSTAAIAAGRYKEVNMIGAASIVALLNIAGSIEIPFVFGGDGATLAIPPVLEARARVTLGALQALARDSFGLALRAGVIAAGELAAMGNPVAVARFAVTEQYAQAAFVGLSTAERLIKDPIGERLLVPAADSPAGADLSGLECRWQDIPSRHGETVSLLVAPMPGRSDAGAILRAAISEIEAVYGGDAESHPLAINLLRASNDPRRLLAETKARAPRTVFGRARYLAGILGLNLVVGVYRRYEQLRGRAPWWDRYRELVFRTADYRKYDDTLRMILAGTPERRQRLERYLEARYQAGELVYGLHVADRALMTCLVFERMGRQVHFVDGADGGYTLAAKALKERLATMSAAA